MSAATPPPGPTRLLLIRHAHTLGNDGPAATLSGRTDLPLSPRGRREVRLLRARLAGESFDALYSSPLRRARETAAAIPGRPPKLVAALQEIDCGRLDGWPLDAVRRELPGLWAINQRQEDDRFRWPGGESYREFRARCLRALRRLAQAHPGGRVAVVTHAGVISQVIGFLGGAGPARWETGRPGTTGLTELEWRRGGIGRVVRFDDRDHLR
jgi:broad specificity phosphatase PhoE